MLPLTYPAPPPTPPAPEARRYFIMATTTLPAGTAVTTVASQHHLLTQFALGFLSIAEVVECLRTDQLGPLPVST